jgi:hypothetical protein
MSLHQRLSPLEGGRPRPPRALPAAVVLTPRLAGTLALHVEATSPRLP